MGEGESFIACHQRKFNANFLAGAHKLIRKFLSAIFIATFPYGDKESAREGASILGVRASINLQ